MRKRPKNLLSKFKRFAIIINVSLLFFCALTHSTTAQSSFNLKQNNDPIVLQLLTPLMRDYSGGAIDSFQVSAEKGETIEIVCRQNAVDISVAAIAPNGKEILKVNSPTQWFGTETLLFTATETGNYTIKIETAHSGKFVGRYEIEFLARSLTGKTVENRLEAVKLNSAASTALTRHTTVAELREGAEKSRRAAELFLTAEDKTGVAAAFLWTGLIENRMGERRAAAESLEKSLSAYRAVGDRAGEAVALGEAGFAYHYLLEQEKGLNYLQQSLVLRQTNLDRLGESQSLTYLCQFYNNTAEFQKGLETCRRAADLRQDGDPAGAVMTLNSTGNLYSNLGDYEKALSYYEQAAANFELAGENLNPLTEASVLTNIGGIKYEFKEYEATFKYISRALEIARKMGNRPLEAGKLRNIGETYVMVGNYRQAFLHLEQSLEIYAELKLPAQQDVLNSLGNLYEKTGKFQSAKTAFEQALLLNRTSANRIGLAETLFNLAHLEHHQSQLTEALSHAQEGIAVFEFVRSQILSKNLRTTLVTRKLERFYELEIEILMRLDEQKPNSGFAARAFHSHESSRARTLLELVNETGFDIRRNADAGLIRRERGLLEEIAARDEQLLRGAGKLDDATESAIKSQINRLSIEHDFLQEEIRRSNPAYAALNQPEILSVEAIQKQVLDSETVLLEYALGEKRSFLWVIKSNSIKTFVLPARDEINRAAKQFFEASSRNSIFQKTTATKLQKMILQPAALEIASARRLLIVAEGALQYVPFAALSIKTANKNDQVTKYDSLIERAEVVNLPSISTLHALRQISKGRKPAPEAIAVLADPVFNADDERVRSGVSIPFKPDAKDFLDKQIDLNKSGEFAAALRDFGSDNLARLPFSGREAAEIMKNAPNHSLLATGFGANRARVLSGELNNYRILHFATHGLLNAENPNLSGLVLSLVDERGNPQNGFLRAQDVYTLKLHSDLVVLSACQSAYGKDVAGEGLISLTRGFMYAGAPRVVASLWRVDDAATAELMRRFYTAMFQRSLTPSAALRTAQIEMVRIKRWENPQSWAGFTIQGDWR